MTPVLEATNLYRFFHAGDDEALALQGVSLALEPGEIVAVTGPSGSGKSTLLACLAGLDEPDGGMVRIDGQRLVRGIPHDGGLEPSAAVRKRLLRAFGKRHVVWERRLEQSKKGKDKQRNPAGQEDL